MVKSTSFNPSVTKSKTELTALANVSSHLFRFNMISTTAKTTHDAIQASLGKGMTLVKSGLASQGRGKFGYELSGFALAYPESHVVKTNEFASYVKDKNIREVARNMYMDDDETVWQVSRVGEETIISKDGNDDIDALLASVDQNLSRTTIEPIYTEDSPVSVVAYITTSGHLESGICFANVQGDSDKSQVLAFDSINDDAVVISNLSIVAFQALENLDEEQDFENLDPLTYYRTLYSQDPDMVNTLKILMKDMISPV